MFHPGEHIEIPDCTQGKCSTVINFYPVYVRHIGLIGKIWIQFGMIKKHWFSYSFYHVDSRMFVHQAYATRDFMIHDL